MQSTTTYASVILCYYFYNFDAYLISMDYKDIESAKERMPLSWQGWFYSIQRVDLLIVSISGAGLYVCLETLRFFNDAFPELIGSVKFAGLFFVLSIVSNLLSQFTGKSANDFDYRMCKAIVSQKKDELRDDDCAKIAVLDHKAEVFTSWTNRLNLISLLSLFAGLIMTMIFFWINF